MSITLTCPVVTATASVVQPFLSPCYYIFSNGGSGPVNYTTPIAGVLKPTLTYHKTIAAAGTYEFGVRAVDIYGEELNTDGVVEVVINSGLSDITNQPQPPNSLTAQPAKAGAIRVSWSYPLIAILAQQPTGFHVYIGTGGTPSYGASVATVAYGLTGLPSGISIAGVASPYYSTLLAGPYTNGTVYTLGVRAYNATSEETNVVTVNVTADSVAPTNVVSLSGVATSQA